MSRTSSGKLRGRAAATERRDMAEYLDEKAEQERRADRAECVKIIQAIRPFFTAEAWMAFCDAGPDDNRQFTDYVRTEWELIRVEFAGETVADLTNAAYMDAHLQAAEVEKNGWDAEHADWLDEQVTRASVRP